MAVKMSLAKIVNCHEASIRQNPMNPNADKDIVGTIKAGEKIKIDSYHKYYDWKDNGFYACETSVGDGYINTELVEEL